MSTLPSIAKHRFNLDCDEIYIQSTNHDGIDFKFNTNGSVFHVPSGDIQTDGAIITNTQKATDGTTISTIEDDGKYKIHKDVKFDSSQSIDFNNCTMSNVGGLNGQLTTANIVSLNGYATADLEMDNITSTQNTVKNRTENLTVNRMMISNNAGLLASGDFAQTKILRNDLTTQQSVVGDLNLASGKRIKYDGVAVELSSASKLNADLSNIGSAVLPEANIHSSITRDNEVNTATQDDLDLKLNLNLSNLGNAVIPEANIHASITRDNEVSNAVIGELSGKMNNDFSNISSGSKLPEANTHADIARVASTVPKAGGTFSGSVHMADGLTIPPTEIIERTQAVGNNLEYCKSLGCLLGCTPSSNNDQSVAGTKTFTDSTPLTLSGLTASQVVVLDGSKNVTTSADNLVSAGDLAKIQALPSVADINAMAHKNDTAETLFANPVGCSDTNGGFCVMQATDGSLNISTANDESKIVFDGGVAEGGFVVSNSSGTCNIDTHVDVTTGHKYKIAGADLNFSHLAGTVADSQITAVTGSKVSGDIPVGSVPSGLSADLVTSGTFDSQRLPSLDTSKIGSGRFINERLPTSVIYNNIDNQQIACNEFKFTAGTSGDCVVTLEANTDNNASGDNPMIQFVQDAVEGGTDQKRVQLYQTSSDNFVLKNLTGSIFNIVSGSSSKHYIGVGGASYPVVIDSGGIDMTRGGDCIRVVGADDSTILKCGAGGGGNDLNIWRIDGNTNTHDGNTSEYGFYLRYIGSGNGNLNTLRLYGDNSNGTNKIAYEVLQDGKFCTPQDIFPSKSSIASTDGVFARLNVLDTPTWTALTVASGMTAGAGGTDKFNRMEYAVSNKRVYLRGYLVKANGTNFASNDTLFNLPSAIRPKFSFFHVQQGSARLYFNGTNEGSSGAYDLGDVTIVGTPGLNTLHVNMEYWLN